MRIHSFRGLTGTAALLTLFLTAGCSYMGPSIRMYGTPRDIGSLVGDWSGEYVGDPDQGRRGSIFFRLAAEEGQAQGDVLMTRDGHPLRRDDGLPDQSAPHLVPHNEVLSISFVQVGDGLVDGVMDPYWDPDRETEARTSFRGRIRDGTIEGRFSTTYGNGASPTGGWWKVRRTPVRK